MYTSYCSLQLTYSLGFSLQGGNLDATQPIPFVKEDGTEDTMFKNLNMAFTWIRGVLGIIFIIFGFIGLIWGIFKKSDDEDDEEEEK